MKTLRLMIWLLLSGMMSLAHAYTPEDTALLMPRPFEHWQTLTTPHFRINFQQAQLPFAQQVAAVAETVYGRLTVQLAWQPKGRIEVVISDTYDGSNGGATVLPYNRFFIFMNGPVDGELQDNAPWIEQVFTHELVHVIHMDQARGLPAGLRHVFGRQFFTFPHIFNPPWVTEGLAVYGETDFEKGFGRGQSALYDAMMRAEVLNGFRTYTEANYQGGNPDWPSGQAYLYGYYFFEFLQQRHGRELAMTWLRNWNGNLIPWRMDSRARKVFGVSAETLWTQYLDYLREKFVPRIAAMPAVEQTALVNDGRVNSDPVWLANGDFYFYRDDGRSRPSIEKIAADGTPSTLTHVRQFSALAVHPQAGVLISRNAICNNTQVFTDLYRLADNGRWQRLTRCGRYPRMAWSAAGQRIAAVHVQDGFSQIVLLAADGAVQQTFDPLPAGETIGQLAWSPDDKQLVASVRRQAGGWNLELLDLAQGQWKLLTRDTDLEQQPQFSADGKQVYFLSDHEEIWNLRRMDLHSGQVETLTRTHTALLGYAVGPGEKLVRTAEYSAEGVMLQQQEIRVTGNKNSVATQQAVPLPSQHNQPDFKPEQYNAITDYSALATLHPRAWFAYLYADSENNSVAQLMVNGQDALGYHNWQLAPAIYLDKDKFGGSAAYVGWHRLALLWDSNIDVKVEPEADVLEQWQTETRYQALWLQPFNRFDGTFRFDVGLGTERLEWEVENHGVVGVQDDNFAGLALNWADHEFYLHSISPEDGRQIRLSQEKYNVLGDGWHHGSATTLDWREYLGLGHNHVLALRAVAGRADLSAKPWELGDELDQVEALGGMLGFGKTGYSLRGYTSNHAEMTGNNLRLLSAEWRIPLAETFDGFTTFPLGLGKSALHLFVDHGAAWHDKTDYDYYTGVGVEWRPELLIGFSTLKLDSTLGFAQGLDDKLGKSQVYLRLGMSF